MVWNPVNPDKKDVVKKWKENLKTQMILKANCKNHKKISGQQKARKKKASLGTTKHRAKNLRTRAN